MREDSQIKSYKILSGGMMQEVFDRLLQDEDLYGEVMPLRLTYRVTEIPVKGTKIRGIIGYLGYPKKNDWSIESLISDIFSKTEQTKRGIYVYRNRSGRTGESIKAGLVLFIFSGLSCLYNQSSRIYHVMYQ